MFGDSSGTEMGVDVDTTMETESRPIIDREEKLRKVEEKLLSNKTYESFTNYDCVMSDDKLLLPQKVIHLQKGVEDSTRRKIYYASLQGQLLEKCFLQSKKVYKETLEETMVTRRWALFLRKLHKLVLNYSELQFCTVSLRFFHSNFKIINPIAYGGGELYGPRHQTVSHNSRTLSSRLPKLSDFSFLLFGQIVAKFQVN